MKASGLMQGDLVLYKYNGEKIHARVVQIYRSSALVESVSKEYKPIRIKEDKIFPVNLTPEILEKNGWIWEDKDVLYLYLEINGYKVAECLPHISDAAIRFVLVYGGTRLRITIQFVHKLQHALRLCGIEKTIEL